MRNNVKKKAKEFVKKYNFTNPSVTGICDILEKQGYTIVWFNSLSNDSDVDNIIKSFSLSDYIAKTRAFTYVDENFRLVFVNEDLSQEEKLIVLLHEEGHIFCEHFSKKDIIGEDVRDEDEANNFAHYVLNPTFGIKLFKHRRALLCVGISVLILSMAALAVGFAVNESRYYGKYYITVAGTKYHEKDCGYVKNKTNIHRMTKEDYNTGDYSPCKKCIE